MKQKYFSPEVEVTLLTSDDILTASLETEVEMDSSTLW